MNLQKLRKPEATVMQRGGRICLNKAARVLLCEDGESQIVISVENNGNLLLKPHPGIGSSTLTHPANGAASITCRRAADLLEKRKYECRWNGQAEALEIIAGSERGSED